MFEAFEDVRDTSFISSVRIKNLLSAEKDLSNLDITQGIYLTPNFHQNFDFNDLADCYVIEKRLDLVGL